MQRRRFCLLLGLGLGLGLISGCAEVTTSGESAEAPAIPVRQAQAGLTALGYRVGPVDGVLGPMTEAAIQRFRNREGLDGSATVVAPAIDDAFADRLAERLAFDGLKWRQRARAVRARQTAAPEPPADGQQDEALEELLSRWENGAQGE
ncbi:MAG: peptidoglycan-binding domain-containing protein [Pseudomonadota bacterium]